MKAPSPSASQPPMELNDRIANLSQLFPPDMGPRERLSLLIDWGRRYPTFGPEKRQPRFRVEGCSAALWLEMELHQGRCHFAADSDSAIVRGVANWLCIFFSNLTPEEVVSCPVDPLTLSGVGQLLAPNRRSGLGRLVERIRDEARVAASASSRDASREPGEP